MIKKNSLNFIRAFLCSIVIASPFLIRQIPYVKEKLSNGKEELDNGLFYQIHKALLCFSRLTKDRIGMIRELYWQGMNYYYIYKKTKSYLPQSESLTFLVYFFLS